MVEQNFYITTAIDYVNGKAHIGHAFEKVITDVIYRHFKQRCDKTMFLTGTDEHGIKIQKTAKSLNITPIELCNQNVEAFQNSWKLLDWPVWPIRVPKGFPAVKPHGWPWLGS